MILVGIGSNLASPDGDTPMMNCRNALHRLSTSGIEVDIVSSFYRSAPIPSSLQPWYINAVVLVTTIFTPVTLLKRLQKIETDMGRVRGIRNEARVIDLDLLTYQDVKMNTLNLVLPHPRICERAFVLVPLSEIIPNWTHPVSGTPINSLVGNLCETQNIELVS